MKSQALLRILPAAIALTLLISAAPPVEAQEQPGDPTAEKFYNANNLFETKLYKLAVAEYQAFLKAYPNHVKAPMARYGLALSYFRLEQYDKADPLLGQLSNDPKFPFRAFVGIRWGSSLLKLNKDAEAEKAFATALSLAKAPDKRERALVGLVMAQSRLGKWKEVIKNAGAALKDYPENPDAVRMRFLTGFAQFNLKQYAEAAKTFDAVLKAKGNAPFAHMATFLLAECKRETEDMAGAEALYAKVLAQKGPQGEQAAWRLGFVQFVQSKWAPAIASLKSFVTTYAKSEQRPEASLYLGRAYLEAKQFPAAEKTLTPLTTQGPVAARATLWLAKTHAAQGKFKQIVPALTAAVTKFQKDPLLGKLLYDLGEAQRELGKFKEAAASFGKAIAANPKDSIVPAATYLQAWCLHKVADYTNSLALCEKYLKDYAGHELAEKVTFLRAENLMLLGKLNDAQAAYTAFAAKYPKSGYINAGHLRIAEAFHHNKEWAKALKAIDEPLLKKQVKGEGFEHLWFLAGDCQFRLKAYDKAITNLQRFLTEQPKHANVDIALFNVGMAYHSTKQTDQAIASWTKLRTQLPQSKLTVKTCLALGRAYYDAEKWADVRTSLAPALKAGDPDALYIMGRTALNEGKDAEAAKHLSLLTTKHSKHREAFDATMRQGAIAVRAKQYPQAEKMLTALAASLVAAQPKHSKLPQTLFYLGQAQARQEKWAAASASFLRVVNEFASDPNAPPAMYELAWCDRGAGKMEQAMKRYEKFLATQTDVFKTSPLVPDVHYELAELEFGAKKYDQALARTKDLLARILAKTPRKDLAGKVLHRLGWCHYEKGAMVEAGGSFEAALKEQLDPTLKARTLFQAGESRRGLREYATAVKHFAAAVATKDPAVHEVALLRLGECQGMVNQWPASQQSYTTFLGTYPKSKYLLQGKFGLGWALENQQKFNEAIAVYQQVVAAKQNNETSARCQFQIGECLFSLKKYDEAITALTLVGVRYKIPTWSAKALLERGRILEAQKKVDAAIATYQLVVEQHKGSAEAAIATKRLQALKK